MDRRRSQLLAVGVLLLAAAYGLPLPDEPVADEATHLLATASLWHDHDLRFDDRDLARGHAVWPGAGPRGLSLLPDPGGGDPVFATPVVYPVFAAPFYGALGARGLRVVHTALYLVMLWLATRLLVAAPRPAPERAPAVGRPRPVRTRRPPRRIGLLLGGAFFATGAVVWVLRFQPEVLLMTCAFVAVALWCRARSGELWGPRERLPLAFAGFLLAGPAVTDPALALLALPIGIDLVWGRRFRAAAVFVLAFLATAALTAGIQHRVAGEWGAGVMAEATVYADAPFPGEAGARPVMADHGGHTKGAEGGEEPEAGASFFLIVSRTAWLLAGRHVGLLPYFPFVFYLLALYLADLSEMKGRLRHLLALTLLAYLGLAVAGFPGSAVPGAAGAAAPGARAVAVVYPLFLFLPLRLRAGRAVVLPLLAAGLWALPALAVALGGAAPRYGLELAARGPAYRALPLELELLADGDLPGYGRFDRFAAGVGVGVDMTGRPMGVWYVPLESFYVNEPNPEGIWVRGAGRSEVFVVADRPLEELRFRVRSVAERNEVLLTGAGERTRVRFDSEAKRAGTPVRVRPELVSRGLGIFLPERAEEERVYRFTVETTGGAVPGRLDPRSTDPRYLGVFLDLAGGM